jgi:glucokinase
MEVYYIGVDIGGASIKFGCFNKNGELIEKWVIPTRLADKGAFILPDTVISIKNYSNMRKWNIEGVGIGVPGPVTSDGRVLKSANLGWDVFDCKKTAKDLLGIEHVEVTNDANAAALGEVWKGAGRIYKDIIMITLGTGIGGGVILNGEILHGVNGAAGEIGHMRVEENENEVCGCGCTGCLEQYASATGVVRLAKRYMKEGSHIYNNKDRISAELVFNGAKSGDENCLEVVDKFGEYLGTALSNVSCVVDPEAFVIGGGVSRAGSILTDKVSEWYHKKSMSAIRDKVFCIAELGNDAGIYGCVRLVIG